MSGCEEQDNETATETLSLPVYDWFTKDFDTPDLTEAKALLDKLRA